SQSQASSRAALGASAAVQSATMWNARTRSVGCSMQRSAANPAQAAATRPSPLARTAGRRARVAPRAASPRRPRVQPTVAASKSVRSARIANAIADPILPMNRPRAPGAVFQDILVSADAETKIAAGPCRADRRDAAGAAGFSCRRGAALSFRKALRSALDGQQLLEHLVGCRDDLR